MMDDIGAFMNTDTEIWREVDGDFYAPSIFKTQSGSIGINVAGNCIVMDVRAWHALASAKMPVHTQEDE